jgi:phage gp36-like protein
MSYNTVTTFKLHAFPSGSFNSIPDVVIENALSVACSEIDSALRKHHTLPMNTGSYSSELALLYYAERTIATYRMMLWRGFKPNIENTADVVLMNQYNEVVGEGGILDKIRNGQMIFPQESDATPTVSENRPKMYGNPGRTIHYIDENDEEWV